MLAGKRARLAPERYDAAPTPPPSTALALTSTRPAEAMQATATATATAAATAAGSEQRARSSKLLPLLPPGWTVEERQSKKVNSDAKRQKLRTWKVYRSPDNKLSA